MGRRVPLSLRQPVSPRTILFIDSTCVLCDGFATRLAGVLNPESSLRISSLHGDLFFRLVSRETPINEDAMILFKDNVLHIGPDAVIALRTEVTRPYAFFLSLLRLFPKGVLKEVYRWVASNRKRWFGSQEVCSLQARENPHSHLFIDG